MSSLIVGFILGAISLAALEIVVEKTNKDEDLSTDAMVNHPSHYNIPGRRECIEEMEDYIGATGVYYFCLGNSFKYRYRKNDKGNRDGDLAKAKWYDEYARKLYERIDE